MPKYIDIHAHTNFKAFDEDRDAVIHRALDNDTWVINVGTQYDTSKKAVEMTNEYKEGVYATIGLHPIHTGASYHDQNELGSEGKEFTPLVDIGDAPVNTGAHKNASPIFTTGFTSRGEIFDKEKYKNLSSLGKVVAIGECGLDYYRCEEDSIEKQKIAFIAQIELANELNLPLMLHIRNNDDDLPTGQAGKSRNAYVDALSILKQYAKVKGDVHFFAGTLEDAKNFIDFGFTISFTGVITYPPRKDGKGCNYEEIIKNISLEMIMADTDSPYVAPIPHRGKRNEPLYVQGIIKKIAEIKGISEEIASKTIFNNASKMFKI
ncbi:MAG TPA: TatD family hydrolase [Candidatus Paceibacterota bacterium]|nr:TatD family hydrolase [Candidatus Paceibacterota bacterium]